MLEVIPLIKTNIGDPGTIFVFPSEVAAEFWKKRSLFFTDKRAVRDKRFISWDKFKEKAFSLSQKKNPVNKYIRTMFAASLLEENRRGEPFLKSIVFPLYSGISNKFTDHITNILPRLGAFRDAVEEGRISPGADIGLFEDLSLLWDRYTGFLEENNLFEPSYEIAGMDKLEGKYFIFFPEVTADFSEFEKVITASSNVAVVHGLAEDRRSIREFRNSREELRWMFGRISRLLGDGCAAGDIAVTVPSLDSWSAVLRREAGLYGIPLDIRQGKALSLYPAGGLFKALLEAETSGYSLGALKSLLLCRSFPWKEREKGEELISFGIKYHCARNYFRAGKLVNLWEINLRRSGNAGSGRYFNRLSGSIKKLVNLKTFSGIKSEVQVFIKTFLDTSRLDSRGEKVFQFCLECLNDLAEAEKAVKDISIPSPYNLWLSALEKKIYVEKSETEGIPVYSYRVSAGINPLYHFIPGASQDKTLIEEIDFPFLREDQRGGAGGADRDFTAPFLDLYNRSGGSVYISCAREDFSGPQLLPGFFVSEGKVDVFKSSAELGEKDIIFSEPGFWSGERDLPVNIYPVQKAGLENISGTLFSERQTDITSTVLPDINLLIGIDDVMKISPTSLESFINCPFAWFLKYRAGISAGEYEIIFSDGRIIGLLYHDILKNLLMEISSEGAAFDPAKLPEYRRAVEKHVLQVFAERDKTGPVFIEPVTEALRKTMIEKLLLFVEKESIEFPGFRARDIEKEFSFEIDESIILSGRIDRVSVREDDLVVVDYKKRNHTAKRDLMPEDGNGRSFQIPFYLCLLEAAGENVSAASYYDIGKGRYTHVVNELGAKSWFTAEEMEKMKLSLQKAVKTMTDKTRGGDFRIRGDDCSYCSFRGICRKKFILG